MSNVVGSIPQLAHNEKGVGATPGDFQRFQVLVVLIDDRLPPAFLEVQASGPSITPPSSPLAGGTGPDHALTRCCLGARASGPHCAGCNWQPSIGISAHHPAPHQRGVSLQCADERDAVTLQGIRCKAPSERADHLSPSLPKSAGLRPALCRMQLAAIDWHFSTPPRSPPAGGVPPMC